METFYCAVNSAEDVDGLADKVVPCVAVVRVEQTITGLRTCVFGGGVAVGVYRHHRLVPIVKDGDVVVAKAVGVVDAELVVVEVVGHVADERSDVRRAALLEKGGCTFLFDEDGLHLFDEGFPIEGVHIVMDEAHGLVADGVVGIGK